MRFKGLSMLGMRPEKVQLVSGFLTKHQVVRITGIDSQMLFWPSPSKFTHKLYLVNEGQAYSVLVKLCSQMSMESPSLQETSGLVCLHVAHHKHCLGLRIQAW